MKAVLLITWLLFGVPPTTNQIEFESIEKCKEARDILFADGARIGNIARAHDAAHPEYAPMVSVVCVMR
jgi:hypothetical protein